jgi:tRNA pseudouridine13 synthase
MAADNKEIRKSIHMLTRKYLSEYVETTTSVKDGKQYIEFHAKHKANVIIATGDGNDDTRGAGGSGGGNNRSKGKSKGKGRRREQWPTGVGKHLQFTLLKSNIDTMRAVQSLAELIRCRESSIGFAGIKDKRAVTAQLCTVYQRKPSDLKHINCRSKVQGGFYRIGDFKYVDDQIRLGDLKGNRFTIVLRDVKQDDAVIEATCNELKKKGFINYFGLQRFGRGANAASMEVGIEYIRGNDKGVVDRLLGSNEKYFVLSDAASTLDGMKKFYKDGDLQGALNALEKVSNVRAHRTEKAVLRSLIENKNDYHKAVRAVPRLERQICVHAYQSFVYNLVLTERIKRYGLVQFFGDLVKVNDSDSHRVGEVPDDDKLYGLPAVHHITEDDIKNNKYTIHDIVLPLPGYEIELPSNSIKTVYQDLLAGDGITDMNQFRSGAVEEYRLRGDYRKCLQYPKDMEWQVMSYSGAEEELVDTELKALEDEQYEKDKSYYNRAGSITINNNSEGDVTNSNAMMTTEDARPKPLRAVRLDFTLSSGTYATMLIREITKSATSPGFYQLLTENEKMKTAVADLEDLDDNFHEPPTKITKTT